MRIAGSLIATTIMAATVMVGTVGYALAGADDSGTKGFWSTPAPGSASGMPQTDPSATTDAQSSTGVAQDQPTRARPHVAVTHMGREHYATRVHRTPVSVAAHQPTHRTLTAAHAAGPQRQMHALHRGSEPSNGQS